MHRHASLAPQPGMEPSNRKQPTPAELPGGDTEHHGAANDMLAYTWNTRVHIWDSHAYIPYATEHHRAADDPAAASERSRAGARLRRKCGQARRRSCRFPACVAPGAPLSLSLSLSLSLGLCACACVRACIYECILNVCICMPRFPTAWTCQILLEMLSPCLSHLKARRERRQQRVALRALETWLRLECLPSVHFGMCRCAAKH